MSRQSSFRLVWERLHRPLSLMDGQNDRECLSLRCYACDFNKIMKNGPLNEIFRAPL